MPRLVTAYYTLRPDADVSTQRVSFGTSGHRGSSFDTAFNEAHIHAITQAICSYRQQQGIDGPLFLGIDTHALSVPAAASALEVLAANGVTVMIDEHGGFTPTPVISHAILGWNRGRMSGLADGIVITPSHNPPADGGFKYNPPNGGAADTKTTTWIQNEANRLLSAPSGANGRASGVKRMPYSRALAADSTHRHDFMSAYIEDLGAVINFDVLRGTALRFGVDPLGGAGVEYWGRIAEHYAIQIDVVSREVDPTFRFMTLDWDGRIRMDPSSSHAMQRLIALRDSFDVAWASDPDHDRHGIVTRSGGLMNPNAYLAVAIDYLCTHRDGWSEGSAIGKTVVSSSMIDRVVQRLGRALVEVPVGFKWFVDGLQDGALAFGGEESAGASFVRRDGSVWTTDKDGIILGLLAAEMTAATGRDPGERYAQMEQELGTFTYQRIDAPASAVQKAALAALTPDAVNAHDLAGDAITAKLTVAPGNGAAIGGLKVITERGWFAARPSGTEDVYKLYAESSAGADHLHRIQEEAQAIISQAFAGAAHA
ncbi:MAG: phosphoglucomutase (alpha-D-glucose-1,6-bisphosphate-dependent) [Longimicrobiales bacterium]